jgi:hypothetical protein
VDRFSSSVKPTPSSAFPQMLSDSESSGDENFHEITINEHYAKAFEYKKEREELQKRMFQFIEYVLLF